VSHPLTPPTPAPAEPGSAPPLSRATKFWYGLGQLAEGLGHEGLNLFLFFYYTSVLGLSGALAGQAILVALLVDAVADPLVGVWSDRFASRWGRRHPFLYLSALPLGVAFYFTFAPPAGLTQLQLFLWLAGFAVLTRFATTLFNVPHLALGAELSRDYEERNQVVALQFFFERAGHGMAGMVAFLIFFRPTAAFPNGQLNPAVYPPLALAISIAMVAAVLLSAWRTQHRSRFLAQADPASSARPFASAALGDLVGSLRNVSFRVLFLGLLLTYVSIGVGTALSIHLGTYFWRVSTDHMLIWGICAGFAVFLGLGFWTRVAGRLDKRPVFVLGLALFAVFTASPSFLVLGGLFPAHDSPLYLPLWILTTGVIAQFCLAATMVTGRSMMADVTDEDALACGRRREGVFFGAASFSAKAAFGVGSQIAGFCIDWVGLAPNAAPDQVGPEVVRGLGLTFGVSILALCGLSLAFFTRYRLTRERHAEVRAALAAREPAAAVGRFVQDA
jgi:Na+/melibiose symporter-like transporter